jgi:hypothetical protein
LRLYDVDDGMTNECGAVGEMRIVRENRSTTRKRAAVPFRPPQIPHSISWDRIRTSAVIFSCLLCEIKILRCVFCYVTASPSLPQCTSSGCPANSCRACIAEASSKNRVSSSRWIHVVRLFCKEMVTESLCLAPCNLYTQPLRMIGKFVLACRISFAAAVNTVPLYEGALGACHYGPVFAGLVALF